MEQEHAEHDRDCARSECGKRAEKASVCARPHAARSRPLRRVHCSDTVASPGCPAGAPRRGAVRGFLAFGSGRRRVSIEPTAPAAADAEQGRDDMAQMTQLKLGKKPAAPKPTDFKFSEFAATIKLPSVPSAFGHGNAYSDWKMLGNDNYGDCVWAGAAHEHMLINKVVHNKDVAFTDASVLADYAAATGFDPNDPSTDNGTDVHQALDYRRKTGHRRRERDPAQDRRVRVPRPEELGAPRAGRVHLRRGRHRLRVPLLGDGAVQRRTSRGTSSRARRSRAATTSRRSARSTRRTRRRPSRGAGGSSSRSRSTSSTTTSRGSTSRRRRCAATGPGCTASTSRS